MEIAEDSQSNESDQKVRDIKEEVDEDEIQLHAEEDESVGVASNGWDYTLNNESCTCTPVNCLLTNAFNIQWFNLKKC